MGEIATIAAIASVIGTGVSIYSSISAGNNAREAQYRAAQQEERQGREEFAAGQREAQERRLEGELIMSRQQAAAAASGGGSGADAPTIIRLLTETAQRSEYGAASVMYGAESRRASLFDSAAARRSSGDNSFLGGLLGALGGLAGGIGDFRESQARAGAGA